MKKIKRFLKYFLIIFSLLLLGIIIPAILIEGRSLNDLRHAFEFCLIFSLGLALIFMQDINAAKRKKQFKQMLAEGKITQEEYLALLGDVWSFSNESSSDCSKSRSSTSLSSPVGSSSLADHYNKTTPINSSYNSSYPWHNR